MLYTGGHGERILVSGAQPWDEDDGSEAGALPRDLFPFAGARGSGGYAFLFPDAPAASPIPRAGEALDRLARAMVYDEVDPASPGADVTGIAPLHAFVAQFLMHDVSAFRLVGEPAPALLGPADLFGDPFRGLLGEGPEGTDAAAEAELTPWSRSEAMRRARNARVAPLRLDTIYGDAGYGDGGRDADAARGGGFADPAMTRLQAALRDGPRLRLGRLRGRGPRPEPALPADGLGDLPRLGELLDAGVLRAEDLPAAIRPLSRSDPRRQRAHIADDRNDENLVLAQFTVAILRLHNALVEAELAERDRAAEPEPDADALFATARRDAQRIFQWLILHEFLPAVCGEATVARVLEDGAPVYADLLARCGGPGPRGEMPLPMEFAFAGARFGHSMLRGAYDYNALQGREADGADSPIRATLDDLLTYTGGGGLGGAPGLPAAWAIDWARFLGEGEPLADRLSGAIDCRIARASGDLGSPIRSPMLRVARRDLRRGRLFNLPSGQALHACFQDAGARLGPPLSADELASGAAGAALRETPFLHDTPLWFYLLKEAEIRAGGARLGPLGARLMAETVVGLIVHSPGSCWRDPGSGADGRWCPLDACRPQGKPVMSFAQMFRAAGLLAPDGTGP